MSFAGLSNRAYISTLAALLYYPIEIESLAALQPFQTASYS
jgi:hypothetical protein